MSVAAAVETAWNEDPYAPQERKVWHDWLVACLDAPEAADLGLSNVRVVIDWQEDDPLAGRMSAVTYMTLSLQFKLPCGVRVELRDPHHGESKRVVDAIAWDRLHVKKLDEAPGIAIGAPLLQWLRGHCDFSTN